jgi:nitroreductase
MNTLEAIAARRSIRRFTDKPIPDDMIKIILNAAILAPSGKNKQPWRFTVVRDSHRVEMIKILRAGIASVKEKGENPGSSEWSACVMDEAPVTIFIFNPGGMPPWMDHSVDEMIDDVVDIQSIGAAIQNMLLAAQELGLGSLWICDVFYAYEELAQWLGESGEMIAAVSLGYPGEAPAPRPRKTMDEVVRWLGF